MKVHNSVGSKERFLEIFQGVNKVQVNEVATNVVQSGTQLVEKAFEELKNKQASVKQTNTQTVDDDNFVEIITNDDDGNEITFRFKVSSNEGDQEGVYHVDDALLVNFKIKSQTLNVDMPENMKAVQEFNQNHAGEIMNVIGEYANFETDTMSVDDEMGVDDEMYEEAIKLIDKVPYKKGTEQMQTSKAYGDEKPTNPALRVKSDELNQFVSESEEEFVPHGSYSISNVFWYEIMLSPDGEQARVRDGYSRENPQTSDWLDIEWVSDKPVIDPNGYNIPLNQVMRLQEDVENGNYVDDEYTQDAEEEDILALPPEYGAEDAAKAFKKKTDDDGTKGIDPWDLEIDAATKDVSDEEVSPEKVAKIHKAYDNLVATGIEAPTSQQIIREIDRMDGNIKPVVKTRGIPKGAEAFYEQKHVVGDMNADMAVAQSYEKTLSPEMKERIIKTADEMLSAHLGVMKFQMPKEQYIKMVKDLAIQMYQRGSTGLNEETEKTDYPDQMGKKFKPKNQMPKKKKRPQSVVKLGEESEIPREYWGNHEDEINEEKLPEPAIEPDFDAMGMGQDDDIEKLAQDKEEAGDMVAGGLADGKSVQEFNPEQIKLGLKVEMEHTDNPMVAIEIAMDHLMEDPEYYTVKDDPEASAQANASQEADEMTDELLGYKPHNVNDYSNEEFDYAAAEREYFDKEDMEQNSEPVDWQEFYTMSKDTSGHNPEFETKYGNQLNKPHVISAIEKSDNYDKFLNQIKDFEDINETPIKHAVVYDGSSAYIEDANNIPNDVEVLEIYNNIDDAQAFADKYNDSAHAITEEQVKMARQALNKRGLTEGMTKKEAVQILIKHNIK